MSLFTNSMIGTGASDAGGERRARIWMLINCDRSEDRNVDKDLRSL